jgi:hypothetical protein
MRMDPSGRCFLRGLFWNGILDQLITMRKPEFHELTEFVAANIRKPGNVRK